MAGQVKVAGTWKTSKAMLVKVGGSWHSASSAWVKVGGVWKQWFIQTIIDTFTRTTSGTLGNTDTGVAWTSLFGTWFANGSQAQSTNSVSSGTAGALSYVGYNSSNATTSITPSVGVGPAVWVTSGGSWWAAFIYSDTSSYTYSCNCVTTCNNCGPNCTICGTYISAQPYNYCDTYGTYCSYGIYGCGGCWSNSGCTGTYLGTPDCSHYTYVPAVYSCSSCVNCACGSTQSCSTCTATSNNYYIRIIKSTTTGAGYTVVTTGANLGSMPAALKVNTSGTTLTATAYSDSNMTTQLGSAVTATNSGTLGTNYGIVKAYSLANQGSTADNFSAGV